MPNTASSKKRLRQSEKIRIRNRATKSRMRSQLRELRDAIKEGDQEKVQVAYRLAQKKVDQAASKHLIHKNAAARTKSRLVKMMKAAS